MTFPPMETAALPRSLFRPRTLGTIFETLISSASLWTGRKNLPLSVTSVLHIHTYDEDVERRKYLRSWCDIERFQTDLENAVFLANRANSLRHKVRTMRDGKRRDEMLAIVQSALPTDDPAIAHELRDGLAVFRDRASDRIWNEHSGTLAIARCDECTSILKSPHARQCIWCGNDWHKTET